MCFKIDKLEKKLTQTNRQPDKNKRRVKLFVSHWKEFDDDVEHVYY